MNTEKVIIALAKAGLTEYKPVTICNGDERKPGLMVKHDYFGLYPGKEQFEKHNAAVKIAKRFGLNAEKRGYCSATLIW